MTYLPLAHLPRSIMRQRSPQNGYSGSLARTILRHAGHRKLGADFFTIKHPISSRPSVDTLLLYDARHQIVVVCLGNLATVKFAFADIVPVAEVVHVNRSVNFRGMHRGAAFPQQVGLVRGPSHENVELLPNERLASFCG